MQISIKEKIYGLSTIWKEAEYNFPFWDTFGEFDWDKSYLEFLDIVDETDNVVDYYLELMRFISLLGDGHTFVEFPTEVYKQIKYYPIKIAFIDGKNIIKGIDKKYDIPLLSEITEINGEPIDEYLDEKILPYCWHVNRKSSLSNLYMLYPLRKYNLATNAYSLINFINKDESIEITTSNGKVTLHREEEITWKEVEIEDVLQKDYKNAVYTSDFLDIRITDDNIGIITIPTFMNNNLPDTFYKYLDELKHCSGFIIDIRNNGGGRSDNADAVSQAFIEGDFEIGKVKHLVHIGAYLAWGREIDLDAANLDNPFEKKVYDITTKRFYEEEIEKSLDYNCPLILNQPLVVLMNTFTSSSSENFIVNLDNINRASLVGTNTYGSTGNPLVGKLPGGGQYRICTRRCTYPNGKEFTNTGIIPHVKVENSLEDYQNGIDKVFEKGLELLKETAK